MQEWLSGPESMVAWEQSLGPTDQKKRTDSLKLSSGPCLAFYVGSGIQTQVNKPDALILSSQDTLSVLLFWDKVSLYNPGQRWTPNPPGSDFWVLVWQAETPTMLI